MRVVHLLQDILRRSTEWFEGTGRSYAGEIGRYRPVGTYMASVVWDDRKFAERYTNEDANLLATALKARSKRSTKTADASPSQAGSVSVCVPRAERCRAQRQLSSTDQARTSWSLTLLG